MEKMYAGARIRTLRRAEGLTQTEMAKRIDLSTSYLNQLENDARPLTITALMAFVRAFNVDASYFAPDSNSRMVADLKDILTLAGTSGVDDAELVEFAERHPEIARGMLRLPRRHAANSTTGHTSPHTTPDFDTPVHTVPLPEGSTSAYEHVRDYFYARRNHIPELDDRAERFAGTLGRPGLRLTRLTSLLDGTHGVRVQFNAHDRGPRRIFDDGSRCVRLRADLTEAQQTFELALQLAFLVHGDLLTDLADAPELPTTESRELGRFGLAQYFAAAVVMPYSEFLETARTSDHDIDRIAAVFGTGFETTAHRLSTLQRPGSEGVPFFFVRTDRAGNISKRQSATGFHFSRTGGSCPLWVVHRAFENPGHVVRQIASMPDGRTYLWVARTVRSRTREYGEVPREFAIGLGCDLDQAHRLVYSRGLDLTPDAATPIGSGCRTCPRGHCRQRAFPATGLTLDIDERYSPDEPYRAFSPSCERR
ncbi:short-chain fatty acyl-CoA regulator family protein [Corynebacterium pygosceleis]|uniref:Short-chain fatty acyl-CoA regulator family protein n=1 Tax=Corynebacterium pygosceleis TaxID=2800406 RepID=A0A9Q4C6S6_9CORY|nr:short-chain fatty acyl-CoA regulator family protein [Corynebacterium pygosceleis]MCK7637660.1 short-chain fatty acyl-CoA regulator family protein [Corynebacterium pygosceleis]MCK7674851.1 short-chain fatty acyl-CoA regulator family protein [Corynebacterium pygosceleis]MCL0119560.1 short-chain fatty acyl-CoA regulator family protein [Corynebacterium pygosceleis]MCX7468011.1 short-chain fatty acyl-CoA regulator family protein [Corynebacterium pygosceleis]